MASITASATMARLIISSPQTTKTLSLSSSSLFTTKTLTPNLPLRHKTHQFRSLTSVTKKPTTTTVSATLSVGEKLPESTLSYIDSTGELQTTTVSDLTKGKKAIFFAVPGAFTPTCSQKHVPGFVEKASELKAKGVETLACISVNDAFVMKAWKDDLKVGDEVMMLSDGNGDFTRAIGVELDLSDKPVGLGVRSRRYALLADDGVVKVLNLEEGGAFTNSSAEDMLKAL